MDPWADALVIVMYPGLDTHGSCVLFGWHILKVMCTLAHMHVVGVTSRWAGIHVVGVMCLWANTTESYVPLGWHSCCVSNMPLGWHTCRSYVSLSTYMIELHALGLTHILQEYSFAFSDSHCRSVHTEGKIRDHNCEKNFSGCYLIIAVSKSSMFCFPCRSSYN